MRSSRNDWWLAVPWMVGAIGLSLGPLLASGVISLTPWDGTSPLSNVSWVGLEHYRQAAAAITGDSATELRTSLYNSLSYSAMVTPLSVAFALVCALVLTQPVRGMRVFGILFYLPHLLSGAATVLIWAWLFNPRWGPVNQILRSLWRAACAGWAAVGGQCDASWGGPDWLYSSTWAKPAVVIMTLWSSGNAILIFVAAIRSVAPEMLESARMDGAGSLARLRYIVTPQVTPAIAFNLITGWIAAMQTFTPSYLLYNREQKESLLFYMLHLYRAAFETPFRMGYACALAWILVLILLLPISVLALTRRWWVTYEGELD